MRIGGASRQGWWAFGLTSAAVLWGVALVVGALVIPTYSGGASSAASDGAVQGWNTTATLVQANGAGVLVPVSIPAVLALISWWILHRRCTRGGSDTAAWVIVGLLGGFALLGALSIGMFILPAVVMLALGARLTPDAGRSQPSVSC
jgi:hypothetical protein